jgi:hypothetical protein
VLLEKIGWTDHLRNEAMLHRAKEERNVARTIRKVNWIGHILLRNCVLKHGTEGQIEGKMEITGRRGR